MPTSTLAQVLAYLPRGSLERWKKPAITLVLVHSIREPPTMLWRSLEALSEAYYVGDSVELRLVLDFRAVGDPKVRGESHPPHHPVQHCIDWR